MTADELQREIDEARELQAAEFRGMPTSVVTYCNAIVALADQLAEARAALREYGPRCGYEDTFITGQDAPRVECCAAATREDRIGRRWCANHPSTDRLIGRLLTDLPHADALRAAEVGK